MSIKTEQDLIDVNAAVHHTAWSRGYVSRRSDPQDRPANLLTRGRHKGFYRVFTPSWKSTYYCVAVYYYAD